MVRFVLPLPPSTNSLYDVNYVQRRITLKSSVRKWRTDAQLIMPRIKIGEGLIRVDVVFYRKFYHANGKWKRYDVHNGIKPLLDAISEKVGFDDSRITVGSWSSVDSESEHIEVVLEELNGTQDST